MRATKATATISNEPNVAFSRLLQMREEFATLILKHYIHRSQTTANGTSRDTKLLVDRKMIDMKITDHKITEYT